MTESQENSDEIQPKEVDDQKEGPILKSNRWLKDRREVFELAGVGLIALITYGLGQKANELSSSIAEVTTNQTQLMEQQNTLMEQQLGLQTVNTLPNFSMHNWVDSPIHDLIPSSFTLTNTGGWARYLELSVHTFIQILGPSRDNSRTRLLETSVYPYYEIEVVEIDDDGYPIEWFISTEIREERFEQFLEDFLDQMSNEYGVTDLELDIRSQMVFSYTDYQGNPRLENYAIRQPTGIGVDWQSRYLRPMAAADGDFITQERMYHIIKSPSMQTWYNRGSDYWNENLQEVTETVYERYLELYSSEGE